MINFSKKPFLTVAILCVFLFSLESCSDDSSADITSDVPLTSGIYSYICYNDVGKCELDVTFNSDHSGEAQEIHYDRHYDIISIQNSYFTWKQTGSKVYLTGSKVTGRRDGSSSVRDDWTATFTYIDEGWFPDEGFPDDYKEYALRERARRLDEQRVKECVSWTKTHDDETCIWEFQISNQLNKYYETSAYQFGSVGTYNNNWNLNYFEDKKGDFIIRIRRGDIEWILNTINALEKKGSANWTSGEREQYKQCCNVINRYLSDVPNGKVTYGYIFVELNGIEYKLDEF